MTRRDGWKRAYPNIERARRRAKLITTLLAIAILGIGALLFMFVRGMASYYNFN